MKHNQAHGFILIFCLAASYFLISGCVESENFIDPESLKTWEIYNMENGLGSDSVWTIAEDKEGNIWVGTINNGVSKFDGKTWTIYNVDNGLINNAVLSIAQDGYGDMWFGTKGGLSILSDNRWTHITSFGGVYALLRDYNDNMWLSTNDYAVLEYENNHWYQYYDDECEWCNIVEVLFEDKERNIWFGTWDGLKKISDQTITAYNQDNGFPGGIIRAMHQDVWGNMWIGISWAPFVIRFNNGNFDRISLSNGFELNYTTTIASDNEGNVWFGESDTGAIKYNGSFMQAFSVKEEFPFKSVTKILKDRNGCLWFGSMNGGVARYMPGLD